jgi:hypothetical protein
MTMWIVMIVGGGESRCRRRKLVVEIIKYQALIRH